MSLQSYWYQWLPASAIFDKDSKKAYVNVANLDKALSGAFSKDVSVIVIVGGSFILATVEATEKNGNNAIIVSMSWDEWDNEFGKGKSYLLNSGSEQQPVLVTVLPKSKQMVKPFATIGLPSSDYPVVVELKSEIASAGGLTFIKAVQIAGLDQFSQVTAKFDAGNPKTTVETFVADKVKAKHLKKGDNDFLEIWDGSQQGIIALDDQQKQERLDRYLDQMRAALREEDGDAFVHYSVSLVDENLKVVLNNQSVKRVRRTRNGVKINYTLEFASGVLVPAPGFSALPYTLIIEKKIVNKTDYLGWVGISGMPAAQIRPSSFNQEHGGPIYVNFSKKHSDSDGGYLELHDAPNYMFLGATLASLTVGNKPIYGIIRLGEDNKVILTKPAGMGQLAWAAKIAGFQFDGSGFIALVALGSAAKPEMIDLRIDFGNIGTTLDVYKGLQDARSLTVAQLYPVIGSLKVTDALVSATTAEINVVTATATIAWRAPSGGRTAVIWCNAENCLEITVPINSRDKFTVCDSNDADQFQEQGVADFLDAAAADIQNEREKELGQIFDLAGGKKIEWALSLQSTNNREPVFRPWAFAVNNAQVLRTGSGKIYKIYLELGAGQLPELDLNDSTVLQIVRTEEQSNGGSKFVEKFVEDIAQQYDNDRAYNIWYLKGDTIIEANAKLTIKAGQQLRLNRVSTNNYFTLTNKGTIILDKGNQLISSGSLFVVNVNPANPLPAFTNDGTITCNGGSIWLENGMTNNGTITNNGDIVNDGGTFTNNGRIDNNATISIRNGASFVGNSVVGRPITNI